MSDTTTDTSKGDDFKAKLHAAGEELKAELGVIIDQKLDELGAKIGAS
jgi:hypothetical protein